MSQIRRRVPTPTTTTATSRKGGDNAGTQITEIFVNPDWITH